MAKKIDIILLEAITGLGDSGDIVSVAEGYARNKLFPEGLAARATHTVKEKKIVNDDKISMLRTKHLAELQAKADLLHKTELLLTAKIKEGGDIYGSITSTAIAKNLNKQANLAIRPKDIILDQAITSLGSQDITIHLGDGIETTIRVTVISEDTPQVKHEDA